MSSAIFILDREFNLIIQRHYREDLNTGYIVKTFQRAYTLSLPGSEPIIHLNGVTFAYLKYDGIILMSPVLGDIDVMCHMSFLYKFGELLKNYFLHYRLFDKEHSYIDSDIIKDNYILIYELFDETLDFGIPQLSEFNILKEYIKLMIRPEEYYDGSHTIAEIDEVEKQVETEINSSISRTSTTKVSWRPKGIFYNKNEFFVNFNEYLRFKFNHKVHKVVLNQITGEILCKSYLSGMPELKLGLNESLATSTTIFNNINYHQCVQLDNLNSNTVSFIPPDGEFKLLSYQILNTEVLQPLILVKPLFRIFAKNGGYRLRVKVDLVTTFRRKYSMTNIKIHIPLLVRHATLKIDFNESMKFKTKLGDVVHSLDKESLDWNISKLTGTMRGEMLAEFVLITEKELWQRHLENNERGKQERNDLFYFELGEELTKLKERKTIVKDSDTNVEELISVEFDLQSMLYSGLKVTFLTIQEDKLKFQSFPWIKYNVLCKDDDYSFVLSDDQFCNDLSEELEENLRSEGKYIPETDTDEVLKIEDYSNFSDFEIQKNEESEEQKENRAKEMDTQEHVGELKQKCGKLYKYGDRTINFEEYFVEDEEREKKEQLYEVKINKKTA